MFESCVNSKGTQTFGRPVGVKMLFESCVNSKATRTVRKHLAFIPSGAIIVKKYFL